jgi:hypothetical protein
MIITNIQELRLASPAHALDSMDGLLGFIDNSEHDFLEDKLGTPLYNALCQWYDENPMTRSTISDYQTGYWNRLLLIAQRVVAFDALGRAIGMQAISVNNSGINQMIADDYPAPDKNGKTIDLYIQTCNKEAHAALNQMLRLLEQWCKEPAKPDGETDGETAGETAGNAAATATVLSDSVAEKKEIVTLWKESRYYYLAAQLLIPSCETLQVYLNIYDSREKFIQLLPDLKFIQEEQIATSVGEDLMKAIVDYQTDGKLPEDAPAGLAALFSTVLHRLRKVVVALLAGRSLVLKYTKEQKVQFHDDGVRMFETAINYLRSHQQDFPEDMVKNAPWYVAVETVAGAFPSVETAGDAAATVPPCAGKTAGEAAATAGAALWTPPLL